MFPRRKFFLRLDVVLVALTVVLSLRMPAFAAVSSFRFIAWADTKSGTAILSAESTLANTLNPAFTVYPGDVCESGPDATCFAVWKNALNGGSTNTLYDKTFATRGNHDSSGTSFWQSTFNFAGVASRIGATNYSELDKNLSYSFDYANAHFIGIDLPGGDVTKITAAQINWMDNDLTTAEKRGLTHAFIFWHGPIYQLADHCCVENPAVTLMLNKHPMISAGFFGHEHLVTYTHIDSSRIANVTHPFEEFISGGAGASPIVTAQTGRYDYWLGNNYGFCAVDVSGATFTVTVYNLTTGTAAKTFTFTKPSSVLYGDVSGDQVISAYDAALTAQYAVKLITFTALQMQAAEVSGDGAITAYDAALVAQRAVGLISKFPVE